MKRFRYQILSFVLILSSAVFLCAFSTFRNETGKGNAGIIPAKTPIDTERSGALWLRSFSGKTISYNSVPVTHGQVLYVVNENQLYELDKQGNIIRKTSLAASMNSVCNLYCEGDFLFIPLDGGRMQCVQCSSMRSVWVSEAFGGQSLSTVLYYNGYVYAGTTKSPAGKTTGTFYCLDAGTGSTVWTYEDTKNPGGYYWSGAVAIGNALYFSGDNGILVSHSLTTDEVYEQKLLTKTGKVRAGITFDKDTNALYTTSNDGKIHRIEVTGNGTITSVLSKPIFDSARQANCTSTPAIWNNRLYVGSSADMIGYISVFDTTTLRCHYHVATGKYKEVKASPLISTGYATKENNHTVYVYFTCNALPGGVFYIKDSETAKNAVLQTLFVPQKKQFCLSSVSADSDGTLYYSNDSGYLFALKELKKRKVKKPSHVTCKKKKKKCYISFRKNEPDAKTLVYIRYASEKWKKVKTISSSKTVISIKKKKTIRIRLRNRIKVNGKWLYSAYTKSCRIH